MKRCCCLLFVVLAGFAAWGADADRSRSEAIVRLLNSRASGSQKGYADAARIVAEDAAKGKPLQQYVLALISKDPAAPEEARLDNVTRENYLDKSRGRIKSLAEKGNPLAWYLLSMENNDTSMLKRAAEGRNVQALNAWGALTLTNALRDLGDNTNDVERVLRKSYTYFSWAADQGDSNGYYNMGMCYMQGYGVTRDVDRAFECFRTAADAGHPEAINNVGGCYRDGIVVERDLVLAARWFAKSAEMGNVYGMLNYGLALQRGEGVKADSVRAVEYFKRAADGGSVEAVNAYAMSLYNGDGVAEDKVKAVALYRVAADRGFPPAMDNLAACYDLGTGGLQKDTNLATVWKIRARAARGDRHAAAWLSENGY